jgi:hypothetical protein
MLLAIETPAITRQDEFLESLWGSKIQSMVSATVSLFMVREGFVIYFLSFLQAEYRD